MTREEKIIERAVCEEKCREFIFKLAELLPEYKLIEGLSKGVSMFLIPEGTEGDVSWTGKPAKSFRFSGVWNWYTNAGNCPDLDVIQCESVDMPAPKERRGEGSGSIPWKGYQVAYYGDDHKYHHVYGLGYDRKRGHWFWNDDYTPEDVLTLLRLGTL